MQEFERLKEAICNVAKAATEMAVALSEYVIAIVQTGDIAMTLRRIEGIAQVCKDHPEWVHRAKYSKKKRIRKKYHDRIMREYGRADNGKKE